MWHKGLEFSFVITEEHEVVGVANIIFLTQIMLHVSIKLIHVNVHQKLRCQIAEGQSPLWTAFKTIDHFSEKPQRTPFGNMPLYYCINDE